MAEKGNKPADINALGVAAPLVALGVGMALILIPTPVTTPLGLLIVAGTLGVGLVGNSNGKG
jgi:hypothetical protein